MAIKPIDLRRKEFKNSLRGYDANQVDDFLDAVADEFERAYTENGRMREEINGLRERLQQFSDLEGSIRAALVHAEQAANDLRESANREAETLRESARREADLTINEAKARSHQMLADSSARVERVQESYEALREAKQTFATDFRHLLKTYLEVTDNVDIATAKEIESSLRGRLDTESLAVAREAATHSEETEAQGTDDVETRAFTPEDMAAAQGFPAAEADEPAFEAQEPPEADEEAAAAGAEPEHGGAASAEAPSEPGADDTTSAETAARTSETTGRTTDEASVEALAPETEEPEVEPSTVPEEVSGEGSRGGSQDDTDPTGYAVSGEEEPAASSDEAPGPEDDRYDAFFEERESPEDRQEGRVSRASRFLRRRG